MIKKQLLMTSCTFAMMLATTVSAFATNVQSTPNIKTGSVDLVDYQNNKLVGNDNNDNIISPMSTKTYSYVNKTLSSNYGVEIYFNTAIDIKKNASTGKYYYDSFKADRPIVQKGTATVDNTPTCKYIESGTTLVVSTNVKIQTSDGSTYNKTAAAYYYLNTSTGEVIAKAY